MAPSMLPAALRAVVLLALLGLAGGAAAQSLAGAVNGGVTIRALAGTSVGDAPRGLFGDASAAPMLASFSPRSLAVAARPLSAQGEPFSREPRQRRSRLGRDPYLGGPPADGDAELACLTQAVYFEARGEPVEGQVAVAEVVLNRRDGETYPDTVCEVVNQGTGRIHACQFSYTCDGIPDAVTDPAAWDTAGRVARAMLSGAPRRITQDATHYHADYVHPYWARAFPRTAEVGRHIFYRAPPGG